MRSSHVLAHGAANGGVLPRDRIIDHVQFKSTIFIIKMPLLSYGGSFPLEFYDLVQSTFTAMNKFTWYLTALLATSSVYKDAAVQVASAQYLLGLGTADITGCVCFNTIVCGLYAHRHFSPVVEINFMGYASPSQVGSGLHMRQRSRAFIVGDPHNQTSRVVFVNADIGMGDEGVRRNIVATLSSQYPGVYTNENIAFVGTHQVRWGYHLCSHIYSLHAQHSGVGGYLVRSLHSWSDTKD